MCSWTDHHRREGRQHWHICDWGWLVCRVWGQRCHCSVASGQTEDEWRPESRGILRADTARVSWMHSRPIHQLSLSNHLKMIFINIKSSKICFYFVDLRLCAAVMTLAVPEFRLLLEFSGMMAQLPTKSLLLLRIRQVQGNSPGEDSPCWIPEAGLEYCLWPHWLLPNPDVSWHPCLQTLLPLLAVNSDPLDPLASK